MENKCKNNHFFWLPSHKVTISSRKLFSKIYQQKSNNVKDKNTIIFSDNLLHSLTGINHLIKSLYNGDTLEFYDFDEREINKNTILITSNKFLLSKNTIIFILFQVKK